MNGNQKNYHERSFPDLRQTVTFEQRTVSQFAQTEITKTDNKITEKQNNKTPLPPTPTYPYIRLRSGCDVRTLSRCERLYVILIIFIIFCT